MRTSKPLRRFLATLGLCLWISMPHVASAQDTGQTEALKFIVGQLGLPEAGSSPPSWKVNKTLFGLSGVTLDAISAEGVADGKPTGALTANLTLAGQKMSGTLGSKAGTGGPEEVWIELTGPGNLKVGQVLAGWTAKPRGVDTLGALEFSSPRVGFRPAGTLAYLSGTLAAGGKGSWKGSAAVTWAGARASLFVRAAEVDLQELLKPAAPARLPKLPESVLLFNSGTGQAPALASLPLPVQAMFSEVTGGLRLPEAFPIGEGFGVWSRVTPQQLGIPDASPLKLPAMLLGGEVNPGQSLALAAAIGVRDLGLQKWNFTSPSFYLTHKQGGGPKLGVSAVVDARFHSEAVRLKGDFAIDTQKGALNFTGTLDRAWTEPFDLRGASIQKDSGVTMSVDTGSNVGLGVQGGLTVSGTPAFKNSLVCLNATLASGPPVVTALGLRFEAPTLNPAVALRLIEGAVRYAANSPAGSALANLPIAGGRTLGTANPRNLFAGLEGTPLPSVQGAEFYLATPGLTCDLPANKGLGAKLAGTMSLLDKPLAETDSGFDLDRGFWLSGSVRDFSVAELFSLGNAKVDIAAPMPTSPQAVAATRFNVSGRSKLAFASGDVVVGFSKDRVRFNTEAALGAFFKASLLGESVGAKGNPTKSLADTTDFQLSLAASADTAGLRQEILKGLADAIEPRARDQRDKGKARRPSKKALDDAKAEADRLNKDVGDVYRALLQVVASADACLRGDTAACGRLVGGAANAAAELDSATRRLKAMASDIERWGSAEARWAALSAAEEAGRAAETLWGGLLTQMEGVLKGAAGVASVVSIERVAFNGRLKQAVGTLEVDVKLDPAPLNMGLASAKLKQSFDVKLREALPASPGKSRYEDFSKDVVAGYAGLKPLEQAPAATATHLTWDTVGGQFVLTAKVTRERDAKGPSGDLVLPAGRVTLFRVNKDGSRVPIGFSEELNARGACSDPESHASFPGREGCKTTVDGVKPFALTLQPGANVFSADYAGNGQYAASSSRQIVILAAESCGSLSKLDGATVRIAVSSGGARFYASVNSVSNRTELDLSNTLYFYERTDKDYQTNNEGSSIQYWDKLLFRLKPIAGTQEFHLDLLRECYQGRCTRLKIPDESGRALQRATGNEWGARWTIVRDPGGSVRLSSAGKLLGRTEKPTSVDGPTINIKVNVRGRATMLPSGSNADLLAVLEEVCTAN